MNNSRTLAASTALASLLAVTPAFAEVTPAQVWNDFKGYMQGFGYAVTATESPTGSGLSVTDITMGVTLPEGGGGVSLSMDEVTFTDLGDGSVEVGFPPVMPIVMNIKDGSDDVRLVLDYGTTGLSMIVSGEPTNMTYTYTAPRMSMVLSELVVDGEEIGRDKASIDIVMEGVSGNSVVTTGNLRNITQAMTMAAVRYTMSFNNPDEGSDGSLSGSMANLRFEGTNALPLEMDSTDMAAMLAAGFDVDGVLSYENGSFTLSGSDGGDTFNASGSSATADIGFAMGAGGMAYGVGGTGARLQMMGGDIPFPVSFEMEETGFDFLIPVTASDEEQDFAAGLTLSGFTMADLLWNIFDPAQVLPRDPATVAIDLTGKARLFLDLLDEEAMTEAGMSDDIPGELNALTINSLNVSAAGAQITGTGDFTFDNTDLETFDGLPRPIGGVDLRVAGANGLIDKLIQMGFVGEEEAMGARMMMSMFGVPGDAPDTLNSKLEINEQGHILANGMRIQ